MAAILAGGTDPSSGGEAVKREIHNLFNINIDPETGLWMAKIMAGPAAKLGARMLISSDNGKEKIKKIKAKISRQKRIGLLIQK